MTRSVIQRISSIVLWTLLVITTSYAVDHHVPGDYSTIQTAIDAALDGDTIVVSDGTYTGDGNRDIQLNSKALTVKSLNGPDHCTIDCAGSENTPHQGFVLGFNDSENSIIEGFTIKNGYTPSDGGAIYCQHSSPLITDCIFENNRSESEGGAIYCTEVATIEHCIFIDNMSDRSGGAIYSLTIQAEHCTVENNIASDEGGGIYTREGSVNSCIISGNMAVRCGGVCAGSANISQCTILNNRALDEGGGVCAGGSVLTENNFSLNQAAIGGGIFTANSYTVVGGTAEQGNSFKDNSAVTGQDIAISSLYAEPVTATFNTFSGVCHSDYYVTNPTSFDLANCVDTLKPIRQDVYVSVTGSNENDGLSEASPFKTIDHALSIISATEDNPLTVHLAAGTYSPSTNGELFPVPLVDYVSIRGENEETTILDAESRSFLIHGYFDDNLTLSGLTLKNGYQASNQGTCLDFEQSSILVSHCIITQNTGSQSAVSISGDANRFQHCLICDNQSTGSYGAGIYNYGNIEFYDCIISGNSGPYDGAGYKAYGDHVSIFDKTVILQNTSTDLGGGVSIERGHQAYFYRSRIDGNHSRMGGGIFADHSTAVILAECVVSGNTALDGFGGGLNCSGVLRSTSSVFKSNSAIPVNNQKYRQGGAIYQSLGETIQVTNCAFLNNYADIGQAIHIYKGHNHRLVNCTFSGNRSFLGSYEAINVWSANPFFSNCIMWDNHSEESINASEAMVTVEYSCVQGGFEGVGIISQDPVFCSGAQGDLYLSHLNAGQAVNSPCIDAGNGPVSDVTFYVTDGEVSLGEFSTRTDDILDTGTADMGVHYPLGYLGELGAELVMPEMISTGEPFACYAQINNPMEDVILYHYPLFVLLAIGDAFLFAPGFSDFDYYQNTYSPGNHVTEVIPVFTWPSGAGSGSVMFMAALTNPEMTVLFGEMDTVDLHWTD